MSGLFFVYFDKKYLAILKQTIILPNSQTDFYVNNLKLNNYEKNSKHSSC